MKGPESYLKAQGVEVPSLMRQGRTALIDSTLRVFIGHDLFYFSGRAERDRFLKDPLRYCQLLTDPVTLARFDPGARSPRLQYHGRPYYFSGDSTFAAFKAAPDSFAVRRGM